MLTAAAPAQAAVHVCLCCGHRRPECSPVNDIGWICSQCEQGKQRADAEGDLEEIIRRWQ
jgi:hypothetical protein